VGERGVIEGVDITGVDEVPLPNEIRNKRRKKPCSKKY
jgi:hypothetical protein